MGMRMPETCWAVFKRQAIKLRDWCIWLVDLSEDKKCSICSINPRYIWYIRRFGDYFSFLPSNWFNRICFEAYFDRKCRVHEVNICTAILCLTVQWHRATYSLVRLPASIFKEKDWWRCKIEAADRPEGLAKPIGLQGEFITDTPLRRWSCTLTGNVLLHRATDLRVVSLTRTVAKQMEVTRTNCKYVTCQK